jgi:anti-anti-sigma regulatory factor
MKMMVVREDEELTHVKLLGRIDLEGIGDLDLEFTRHTVARRRPTLVDISDVDYIASIGLRMLVNPLPDVEDVLRTAGFDKVRPIEHDYESAIETLKTAA